MKDTTSNHTTNISPYTTTYRWEFYGWDSFPCTWRERLAQLWSRLRTPHYHAVWWPKAGPEQALVEMIRGWTRYADSVVVPSGGENTENTQEANAQKVNVQAWSQVGWGLGALLNGPTGRLEGSKLSGLLSVPLHAEGFPPPEDYEPCDFEDDSLFGLEEWEKGQVLLRRAQESADACLEEMIASWRRYVQASRVLVGWWDAGFEHSPQDEWEQIGDALCALLAGASGGEAGASGGEAAARWERLISQTLEAEA